MEERYRSCGNNTAVNDINHEMIFAIQIKRVEIQKYNNQPAWKRCQCDKRYKPIREIAGSIGKNHRDANAGSVNST